MKRKIVSGILAVTLIVGGGAMAYVTYAQINEPVSENTGQIPQQNQSERVIPQNVNITESEQKESIQAPFEQVQPIEQPKENVQPIQSKQNQKQIQPNIEEAQKFMEQQGVNVEQAQKIMEEQGIDSDEMYKAMSEGNFDQMAEFMNNQNVDFNEMQEYMNQVNPNGQIGPQGNFQGMRNFR